MTGTFVRPGTLRSSAVALASARCLIDVSLAGTPASAWPHYRPYLILRVPQLCVLDGKNIGAGERVAAGAAASVLDAAAAAAETEDAAGRGVTLDAAYDADADDAAEADAAQAAAAEVVVGGASSVDGVRAWSRVTRLADALAAVAAAKAAEEKKQAAKATDGDDAASRWPRTLAGSRTSLPPLPTDGSLPPQTSEGDWDFTLDVTPDEGAVELTVSLGRGVRAGGVDAHVSPRAMRLLAAGFLLTVHLPLTVDADAAVARRSAASGALVVTAPRALGGESVDVALLRPRVDSGEEAKQAQEQRGVAAAVVTAGESPPLLVLKRKEKSEKTRQREKMNSTHSHTNTVKQPRRTQRGGTGLDNRQLEPKKTENPKPSPSLLSRRQPPPPLGPPPGQHVPPAAPPQPRQEAVPALAHNDGGLVGALGRALERGGERALPCGRLHRHWRLRWRPHACFRQRRRGRPRQHGGRELWH